MLYVGCRLLWSLVSTSAIGKTHIGQSFKKKKKKYVITLMLLKTSFCSVELHADLSFVFVHTVEVVTIHTSIELKMFMPLMT